MEDIALSVIISTYNQPKWLEKVLLGYNEQAFKNFEVIIADDGSTDKTKHIINQIETKVNYPIQHVWHPDQGFQKTIILNKATLISRADYILFTDGDCIPRKDFLSVHMIQKEKGYFLSGGYFKLPKNISDLINEDDIKTQRCFDKAWLVKKGLQKSIKTVKLSASGFLENILNRITPTKASWNGHNSSGWKLDILKVNGFDERMQYGGEDRELGERLFNLGIKSKQIRYSAICLHLDHERGYVQTEMIEKNLQIRKATKEQNSTYTSYGIEQHSALR